MPKPSVEAMSNRIASSVGGRVEAVRPEPLVEEAELEERLAVEQQPGGAVAAGAERDLAQAEVARRFVDHGAVLQQRDLQVVEERVAGGPEVRPRNGEAKRRGAGPSA